MRGTITVYEPDDFNLGEPHIVADRYETGDTEESVRQEAERIWVETWDLFASGDVDEAWERKVWEDYLYADTLAPAMRDGWGTFVGGWLITVDTETGEN